MAKRFEKALAKWPKATILEDGGVHVTGKYDGPFFYRAGGFLFFMAALGIAIYLSATAGNIRPGIQLMLGFGVAWVIFLRALVHYILGRNLNVRIYPDRVAVPGWFGYRKYSREMPIEFRIDQHRLAVREHGTATTYRRAIEVVMQYGEKRVPLAEMPQENIEMARALVIRLQNICNDIDLIKNISGEAAHATAQGGGEFGPVPDIR